MKKTLLFVAIATLFFAACQKELSPSTRDTNSNTPCFKASIEQLVDSETKATINVSNQLVWAEGDKIDVYFPTWGEKYQAFTLSGKGGDTEGDFTRDQSGDYSPTDASIAFFPYDSEAGGRDNNISDGVWYYKLKDWYDGYTTSGKMLTPLIASISNSDNISFKHAAAAVKLTINNLVSGSYKVKMTAYNKQITGYFHITAANAGTDALVLNGAEDVSKNYLTLNTWKSSGAFSWIFPVPALNDPKLKFEITDDNDILVWKKSLAAQTDKDLARGDILVMPAISISPYQQFSLNTSWSVSGDHNSWGDTKMVSDGTLFIAKSVTFAANQEFKIRTYGDSDWSDPNYGWDQVNGKLEGTSSKDRWHINTTYGASNNNIKITTAGTYDIIFNSSGSDYCGYKGHEIRVVQNGFSYPLPKETAKIKIDGSFGDWASVTSESAGNTTVKVVSSADSVFVYVNMTNVAQTIWSNTDGNQYIYALFDLDGNPANDVDIWENYGDFVMLLYPYGGSSASPAFISSAASSSSTWQCKPTTSPYTIGNVKVSGIFSDADGDGKRDITYEFCIPRDDMPDIPSTDPITITFKGSKISSNVSISRLL